MRCPDACGADVRYATTPSGRAVALDVQPVVLAEDETPVGLFWIKGTEARPALPLEDRGRWQGGLYREHVCEAA